MLSVASFSETGVSGGTEVLLCREVWPNQKAITVAAYNSNTICLLRLRAADFCGAQIKWRNGSAQGFAVAA
jgi:hypothetical protein